jgi:hypothetical protein
VFVTFFQTPYDSSPSGLGFCLLLPRLCLGLIIFKAFSLKASKMLVVLGAFAPIPKGSNVNGPACNAGRPMKPLPKPEGLEFDLEPNRTHWLSFSPKLNDIDLEI